MNHSTKQALFRTLPSAAPSIPPSLPPLKSIQAKVCMDEHIYLPSTWRAERGKLLSNKRIAEYQREGKYGSGLLLPPLEAVKPCRDCKSKVNTRQVDYSYLPCSGVYCLKCRTGYKLKREQERERVSRLKEVRLEDWL